MFNLQENVKMAQYTSFGIGGPAKFFVEVENVDDLKEAIKTAKGKNVPFFILGGGSNVLINDTGYSGLVIKLKMDQIEKSADGNLKIGSGAMLSSLIKYSMDNSLSGMEWAAGIPGTVGGAVVGNAGTADGQMENLVRKVEFFDIEKFGVFSLEKEKCDFQYRSSYFKGKSNIIILNVEISLPVGNAAEIKAKIEKNISERKSKQPQGRSAGSFFVNPVVSDSKLREDFEKEKGVHCKDDKIPAGWFIEKIDFKGKRVGGAEVSPEHANFILNVGNATAQDFVILASLIKQKVRSKYGVQLQEEVQYIGF